MVRRLHHRRGVAAERDPGEQGSKRYDANVVADDFQGPQSVIQENKDRNTVAKYQMIDTARAAIRKGH